MRSRLTTILVLGLLVLAACSSEGSSVSETAEGLSESVSEGVNELTSDAGSTEGGGDLNITIGDSDSGDATETEKLPDWAIALLVAVAVLAVVGVVLGYQNRSAQKTSDAAEEGYRRGRQDATSSQA